MQKVHEHIEIQTHTDNESRVLPDLYEKLTCIM